jgi:hypothetical protein
MRDQSISQAIHRKQWATVNHIYKQLPKISAAEQTLVIGIKQKIMENYTKYQSYLFLTSGGMIDSSCLLRLNDTGICSLKYKNNQFVVEHDGKESYIAAHDMDDTLRSLNIRVLPLFLKRCKIGISKGTDGCFMLRTHVNGSAGGPLTAYYGGIAFDFTFPFITQAIVNRAVNSIPSDFSEKVGAGVQALADTTSKTISNVIDEGNRSCWEAFVSQQIIRDREHMEYLKSYRLWRQVEDFKKVLRKKYEERFPNIFNSIFQQTSYYFKDSVVQQVASGIKQTVQNAIPANLFNSSIQDSVTGAFKSGAVGTAAALTVKIGATAIAHYAVDPTGGTNKWHTIGATSGAIGEQSVLGSIVDEQLTAFGLAMVAMNGFFWGSTKFMIRGLVRTALMALPTP